MIRDIKKRFPGDPLDRQFSVADIVKSVLDGDWASELTGPMKSPFINIPKNSISIDVRRVSDTAAGTNRELFLSFQPPRDMEAIITGYGIFSDAQFAAQANFEPFLNDIRLFPYHGTPDPLNPTKTPYKISLGLGPDLNDQSLIECALRIGENDTFKWLLTNSSTVTQTMGIRFKGFIRPVSDTRTYRIGG